MKDNYYCNWFNKDSKSYEKSLNQEPKTNSIIIESNLKQYYTFENFITGVTNQFAKNVALAVAETPGLAYNPLYIYGGSGLGKTHLLHAIGNYITNTSNKRVLYITSNSFAKDVSELNDDYLKQKYRSIDVLLLDDLQDIQTSNKVQQELFNIFNHLYSANKQLVVASDVSVNELNKLDDRLRNRFCWGVTANLYPPDASLRDKLKHTNTQTNHSTIIWK